MSRLLPWILVSTLFATWVLVLICMTADSSTLLKGMPMLTIVTKDIKTHTAAVTTKSILHSRDVFSTCAKMEQNTTTSAEQTRIADYYDLHMFTVCQGQWDDYDWPSKKHNIKCSPKSNHPDFTAALSSGSGAWSHANSKGLEDLASDVDKAIAFLSGGWIALSALYGMTVAFVLLALMAAVFWAVQGESRIDTDDTDESDTLYKFVVGARLILTWALVLAFFCLFAGLWLSVGLIVPLREHINEATRGQGIRADTGKNFIGVSCVALLLIVSAALLWFIFPGQAMTNSPTLTWRCPR